MPDSFRFSSWLLPRRTRNAAVMNSRRQLISLAIAGMTVAGATGLAGATGNPPAIETAAVVRGCVIRFNATGPAIFENSSHLCTGASSVSVLANGDLEIVQTVAAPVISVTVEEDETLSTQGVIAGASGGVRTTIVRFYSTQTGQQLRADSPVLQDSSANLWDDLGSESLTRSRGRTALRPAQRRCRAPRPMRAGTTSEGRRSAGSPGCGRSGRSLRPAQ